MHFPVISNVFYKPLEEKIQRNQIWRIKGPENGSPSCCPTIRKLLVQKGTNTMEEVRWCTI